MPFIHTRVNRPISPQQELSLTREMGQAVSLLGKSEQWLMLHFEDDCRMAFQGRQDAPVAFVSVQLFGAAGQEACGRFTQRVTQILGDTLSIPAEGVYVAYGETRHWGWQGSNF